MKYSPPLDGIRAIAILAVLVYHVFPKALPGGFMGVDVFFVLSGYLIASVILFDLRDGSFSMREFYLRRIQRLLPNAAATVLVTVALARVLLVPSEAASTARHGLWALFNVSNFYIWRNVGGYWGNSGEYAPFLHTWSLAVEEQFYLAFPAILLFLSKRRRPKTVTVVAILTMGSLALSIWGSWNKPGATFYLLPTRAWEPLLGVLLAMIRVPSSAGDPVRPFAATRLADAVGWLGTASIVAVSFLASGDVPFPGVIALVPTVGAAAVIQAVAESKGTLARALSLPPLVLIGQMSYSLYLWHWPGIVLGRYVADFEGYERRSGEVIGALAGCAAAVAAFYLIEQPLRRRGPGRHKRLLVIGFGLSAATAASLFIWMRPVRTNLLEHFDRPSFSVTLYNTTSDGITGSLRDGTRYADMIEPPSEPRAPDCWRDGGIVHLWGGKTPRVVVLGSSHALMYGKVIDDACREMGLSVAFLSADGMRVWFGNDDGNAFSKEFDEARRRSLRDWKPEVVVVIDRWDDCEEASFSKCLSKLADELESLGSRVIVLSQPPVMRVGQSVNLRDFVAWKAKRDGRLPKIGEDEAALRRRELLRMMAAVVQSHPHLELLRVDDAFLLPDGTVRYAEGRKFFYADDDHLSQAGAELVRDRIAGAIARGCGLAPSAPATQRTSGGRMSQRE